MASLHGRVAGLEQARRQLLERANHEVRNSLFTLRHTVELEARSQPADPRLDAILGRIRALFLTYSHLADSAFESTDARPLLEQIVPDDVDLDLGDSELIIADRETRWLAQALHELTSASSAPVESVRISLEDDVVDAALRWRPGHRFDPAAEPVRWSIAEKLICEGLNGRIDDTGEALHIRCFVEDLQIGGQVRQMPGGFSRGSRP